MLRVKRMVTGQHLALGDGVGEQGGLRHAPFLEVV
jgi:hypothetical protein